MSRLEVEVKSSGGKDGSGWINRDRQPTTLLDVLIQELARRYPRDGVAVIIRVQP